MESGQTQENHEKIEDVISFYHDQSGQTYRLMEDLPLTTLAQLAPAHAGALLSKLGIDHPTRERLNEVFSMAFPTEKYFLYNFFRHVWNGRGDVMEIGSYLGSTTRAILMGMSENRSAHNPRFTTVDRFFCDSVPSLKKHFIKLHDDYKTSDESMRDVEEKNDWHQLFKEVHEQGPGADFLNIIRAVLPDTYDDPFPESLQKEIDRTEGLGVLFIDGFKSWVAIKLTMKKLISKLNPGSYIIFQDYGWPMGFWHPCFIETFKMFFKPAILVDDTHAFEYVGGLDEKTIDLFPDHPTDWPAEKYKCIYQDLTTQAFDKNDTKSLLNYSLQLGTALAAIGHEQEGEAIYNAAASMPCFEVRQWHINNYKPSRQRSL